MEFVPYDDRLLYCTPACAHSAQSERYLALIPIEPPECIEPGCANQARLRGGNRLGYDKRCRACFRAQYPDDSEKAKARQRRKTHIRRAKTRRSDVSLAYEIGMRRKTKRCPLCRVRLIDQPYLPTSKELDHMIPLNVGGTHTMGNVRIICRSCNLKRPNDGSDYTGPVTLWAMEVA